MGAAICMKLSCLPCAYVCVCMCVHARACVWRAPPTPTPTPRATGSPKHKNLISLELIEIIRFCLKIFTSEHSWTHIDYSWSSQTPPTHLPHPPRAEETQIGRITITLERIEIIQFCLKICDPLTLLHTYRLGLMCRWGGVLSQMALLCFGPKKVHLFCSCEPPIKSFSVFALDPIRPYLDWALRGFLTS